MPPKHHMAVLAIDMLTTTTRLALGGHERAFEPSRDQAELLPNQIKALVTECNQSFESLSAILVITGPGSFTGLRVALSSAHAMGLSLDIPVIGVRADEAYQVSIAPSQSACLILDTRRPDFAVAYKQAGVSQFSDFAEIEADKINPNYNLVLGNGAAKAGLTPDKADIDLVKLIQNYPVLDTKYNPNKAQVFYLRAPDVTLSPQKFEHQALYK